MRIKMYARYSSSVFLIDFSGILIIAAGREIN
jgi:hypothetical protein